MKKDSGITELFNKAPGNSALFFPDISFRYAFLHKINFFSYAAVPLRNISKTYIL